MHVHQGKAAGVTYSGGQCLHLAHTCPTWYPDPCLRAAADVTAEVAAAVAAEVGMAAKMTAGIARGFEGVGPLMPGRALHKGKALQQEGPGPEGSLQR